MVNIFKKNKELLILIGIVLALAICAELPSWVKGGYFVGGGDIKTQWYPFYVLNRRETAVEGNAIVVKGIDKEKVGQFAAEIRDKRRPEPYKGKGIKYSDEVIRRKVGKTGKK